MRSKQLALIALLIAFQPVILFSQLIPGKHLEGETYALLIGISEYENEELNLKLGRQDAKVMEDHLLRTASPSIDRDHLQILTDKKATRNNILAALTWLVRVAKKGDRIMIFFSGQGAPRGLACHDFDTMSGANLLSHNAIKTLLKKSKSKQIFMLIDANHAGAADKAWYMGAAAEIIETYKNTGISILLSCSKEESSLAYSSEGISYFTHFLLEGIFGEAANKNGDNLITIGEVFEYVEERIKLLSEESQTPQKAGNFDPNILIHYLK
ncbi:MAG: caspase family protein [Bacteroidota bacterium]